MKIGFVTTSIPFPARQGVELPLSKIIEHLSKEHEVDLLVTRQDARPDPRVRNVPEQVRHVGTVMSGKAKGSAGLLDLLRVSPRGISDELVSISATGASLDYDVIWTSPFTRVDIASDLADLHQGERPLIALGHNDCSFGLYSSGLDSLWAGRIRHEWPRVVRALRSPSVGWFERAALLKVDLIHLQTEREATRVKRLLRGAGHMPSILVAPNGLETSLLEIERKPTAPNVLLMTHLAGGRRRESRWFLQEVWPLVMAAVPSATLKIVGTPPPDLSRFLQDAPPGIEVCGFVPDLSAVLAEATVSVLPTLHSSGLVNRAVDCLAAGVPLVGSPQPLGTVAGLEPNVHALAARTSSEFASCVVNVLSDRALQARLSTSGRDLAREMPTWRLTTERIESALLQQIGCL